MNHSQIVSFIWGVADLIRDTFKQNLRNYIAGFSPNMREVLEKFDFDDTISKLDEAGGDVGLTAHQAARGKRLQRKSC